MHRRPDRAAHRTGGGRALDGLVDDLAEAAHVLDGDHDLDLERLADPGVDDGDRTGTSRRRWPPRNRAISSSGRWVADSPMRWGGVSHRSSSRSRVRARWAPRLVAARAWISSMITVSTPAQGLPGRRGEHQVERLGRGDEQVGRVAHQPAPLVGRRVAGAHADRRLRGRDDRAARPPGGCPAAGPAGSSRRRRPGPAAARRRGPACAAASPAAACSSGGRSPTGRRPGSCPTRSGRGSACGRRRRWPATPAPGPRWGRRRSSRTRSAPAPRTARAPRPNGTSAL